MLDQRANGPIRGKPGQDLGEPQTHIATIALAVDGLDQSVGRRGVVDLLQFFASYVGLAWIVKPRSNLFDFRVPLLGRQIVLATALQNFNLLLQPPLALISNLALLLL